MRAGRQGRDIAPASFGSRRRGHRDRRGHGGAGGGAGSRSARAPPRLLSTRCHTLFPTPTVSRAHFGKPRSAISERPGLAAIVPSALAAERSVDEAEVARLVRCYNGRRKDSGTPKGPP